MQQGLNLDWLDCLGRGYNDWQSGIWITYVRSVVGSNCSYCDDMEYLG